MKPPAPDTDLSMIEGLLRCEQFDREALAEVLTDMTHAVYSHEQVYGQYCTVQAYIECSPEEAFEYMANPLSLGEWTYSVRYLTPSAHTGVMVGVDAVDTPIYVKAVSCREAMTVDYHCAWDQGDQLWMIYLNRIVSAELVLDRPGSVVIWTNCHHPFYDRNPFPELSPRPDRPWVGDWWPMFYAGHQVELNNLKRILEYRHRHARG